MIVITYLLMFYKYTARTGVSWPRLAHAAVVTEGVSDRNQCAAARACLAVEKHSTVLLQVSVGIDLRMTGKLYDVVAGI